MHAAAQSSDLEGRGGGREDTRKGVNRSAQLDRTCPCRSYHLSTPPGDYLRFFTNGRCHFPSSSSTLASLHRFPWIIAVALSVPVSSQLVLQSALGSRSHDLLHFSGQPRVLTTHLGLPLRNIPSGATAVPQAWLQRQHNRYCSVEDRWSSSNRRFCRASLVSLWMAKTTPLLKRRI